MPWQFKALPFPAGAPQKVSPQQCPQRERCGPPAPPAHSSRVSSKSPPGLISAGTRGFVLQISQERRGRRQGAFEAARSAAACMQSSWRQQEAMSHLKEFAGVAAALTENFSLSCNPAHGVLHIEGDSADWAILQN